MTVTVSVSSRNLDYFDDFDLSALGALSFDDSLASFDPVFGDDPDVSLSSNRLSFSDNGYAMNILGRGFAPTSSIEALSRAFEDGTVRGTVSGLTFTDHGTEVLGISLTPSSLQVRYDDIRMDIRGALPTSLPDILETMFAIISLSDSEYLTDAEIAEQTAVLAAYQVTSLSLSQSGTELISASFGRNTVSVRIDDFTLSVNGRFPTDLGSAVPMLSLLGDDVSGDSSALSGLRIDNVILRAPDNTEILRATGDFISDLDDPNADEIYLVDGFVFDHMEIDVPLGAQISNYMQSDYGRAYIAGLAGDDTIVGRDGTETLNGNKGDDVLTSTGPSTTLLGGLGNDRLNGSRFADIMLGGDGEDTIIGGDGNDSIMGGDTSRDRRDDVFAGRGNDHIDGGYGNDRLHGDDGNDTIIGGFGADTLHGGNGDDVLSGSDWGDKIIGGDGDDFINGGFGHDRLHGGTGADLFFHAGIKLHNTDWVKDYNAAQGDVLLSGIRGSSASDYVVNFAITPGADDPNVAEAFIGYKPTGQKLWALVDGGDQTEINIQIAGQIYDLLA